MLANPKQNEFSSQQEVFSQAPRSINVLAIDDQEICRKQIKLSCSMISNPKLNNPVFASTIEEGIELISSNSVHVLLLDKDLGKDAEGNNVNGIDYIPELLEIQPHLQILVFTGNKSFEDCVESMKLGAFGYIPKDSPPEYLHEQMNRAYEVSQLKLQKIRSERQSNNNKVSIEFPGNSSAVRKLKNSLVAISETPRPVLLVGDTGTGKTTAARWIHQHREKFLGQSNQPFFSLNMGALPPNLVESELYGYEKGAFTDAKSFRPGYIELANNGTLFLDEIGEASLDLQAKLLKIIEEGRFVRIGGTQERQSHFKLICATNRNLEEMVAEGKFREDLYMRISTFVVPIPDLEQRKGDIPEIIESVFQKCCAENSRFMAFRDLPLDLIEYLKENPPRGNIRGIEQFLSRLLVHAPRDKDGKPVLSNWKRIKELRVQKNRIPRDQQPLSVEELKKRPFDLSHPSFTGAADVVEAVYDQMILSAMQSEKSQRKAGRLLNVDQALVCRRLKKLKSKGVR